MRRPMLATCGAVGVFALGLGSFGAVVAGAAPKPHSDQVITVKKVAADTGAPLAGAVFTLYRWHGSVDLSSAVATATSGSNGVAVFNLEGHHNYAVAETVAPQHYQLPTSPPVVVKTAHETNTKGSDDPANVKESQTVTFTDAPVPTTPPSTPSGPPTSPGTGSSRGSAIAGATTVHTGALWSGSAPYAAGAAMLGGSLLGTGLLMRRRRAHGQMQS